MYSAYPSGYAPYTYRYLQLKPATMKVILTQIFILIVISINAIGQINYNDLNGVWTINNYDSSYYRLDTIKLFQDINYQYEIGTCDIIEWQKDKRKFSIHYINICSEPGRAFTYDIKETINLIDNDNNQIIEIRRDGKSIESFCVLSMKQKRVDRYPYDIKVITLKRIKENNSR